MTSSCGYETMTSLPLDVWTTVLNGEFVQCLIFHNAIKQRRNPTVNPYNDKVCEKQTHFGEKKTIYPAAENKIMHVFLFLYLNMD